MDFFSFPGAEWPGFDQPLSAPAEPVWEPTSANLWSLPQSPVSYQKANSTASQALWNSPPMTTGSVMSLGGAGMSSGWGNYGDIWTSPGSVQLGGDVKPGSVDMSDQEFDVQVGGSQAATLFDPFNSLEFDHMRSIWNPTSTGSGTTGWGFPGGKTADSNAK